MYLYKIHVTSARAEEALRRGARLLLVWGAQLHADALPRDHRRYKPLGSIVKSFQLEQ